MRSGSTRNNVLQRVGLTKGGMKGRLKNVWMDDRCGREAFRAGSGDTGGFSVVVFATRGPPAAKLDIPHPAGGRFVTSQRNRFSDGKLSNPFR